MEQLPMATRSPLLSPALINLDLAAVEQNAAIMETARMLAPNPGMGNFARFCEELLDREAVGATHLGNGVALPHARTAQVNQILLAAGRSKSGVKFADVAEPVHLIFVVAAPKNQIGEYLATVGMMARSLRNPACLQQLLECASADEFAKILQGGQT